MNCISLANRTFRITTLAEVVRSTTFSNVVSRSGVFLECPSRSVRWLWIGIRWFRMLSQMHCKILDWILIRGTGVYIAILTKKPRHWGTLEGPPFQVQSHWGVLRSWCRWANMQLSREHATACSESSQGVSFLEFYGTRHLLLDP